MCCALVYCLVVHLTISVLVSVGLLFHDVELDVGGKAAKGFPEQQCLHLGIYGVQKSQNQLKSEILLFLSNYTIKSIFSGVSPPPHPPNWKFSSP